MKTAKLQRTILLGIDKKNVGESDFLKISFFFIRNYFVLSVKF